MTSPWAGGRRLSGYLKRVCRVGVACVFLAALTGTVVLAAARAGRGQDPQAAPSAPAVIPTFDDFLAGVRAEARMRGVSEHTLDVALGSLQPDPLVVTRDRAQPELTDSLDNYVTRRLTPKTIAAGRDELAANRILLARVERVYGVPPGVMVAIWGLESNYGRFTGTYATVQALATLAYDARRPIFRTELLAALAILDRGQVDPAEMKGSWAGAMGQPQFMPSSFLEHAVDFDGDGRIDIWSSASDVLGSIGNFLRAKGWTAGERWGREVRIPAAAMARIDRTVPMRTSGCRAVRELTDPRPLTEWKRLGVRLPVRTIPASVNASLVRGQGRNFLVYRNYETLLQYNCSNSYAVTIGLLSDRIAARR